MYGNESMDFNNADVQGISIPKGTVVRTILNVRSGDNANLTTTSQNGNVYLDCEYTIIEGPHVRKKIFDKIGIQGTVKNGKDVWGDMGRSTIRAILESARGIEPNDESPQAQSARRINSYNDLNGLEFLVKVGEDLNYNKNTISSIVTPNQPAYKEYYGQGQQLTKPAQQTQTPPWVQQPQNQQMTQQIQTQVQQPAPQPQQQVVPAWVNQ